MDGGATMDAMADEPAETGNGSDSIETLRREAANWRRQVRDLEGERDGLRTRLDTVQKSEVERLAADLFTDPSDVWAVIDLNGLKGDDGLVSTDRAEAELQQLAERKPHWKKTAPPVMEEPGPRHADVHAGAREPEPTPLSFGAELKAVRHG